MKDYLNEYTDFLKDKYYEFTAKAKEAAEKEDCLTLGANNARANLTWDLLFEYIETVLKMKRYATQRNYAINTLRKIDERLYDACMKARKKRKPFTGDSSFYFLNSDKPSD